MGWMFFWLAVFGALGLLADASLGVHEWVRDRWRCRHGRHRWTSRGQYPDYRYLCLVCGAAGTREEHDAQYPQ